MDHPPVTRVVASILLTSTILGCGPSLDSVQVAREAADRQAEQNKQMAKLSEEMARNSQRVIEADAESRREVLEVQHELIERDADGRRELTELHQETQGAVIEQQTRIDRKYDALDQERQEIAERRHRDPIIAAAIQNLGILLAGLAPIGLAAWMLYVANRAEPSDAEMVEILLSETAPYRLSNDKAPLRLAASEPNSFPADSTNPRQAECGSLRKILSDHETTPNEEEDPNEPYRND